MAARVFWSVFFGPGVFIMAKARQFKGGQK